MEVELNVYERIYNKTNLYKARTFGTKHYGI